MDTLSEVEETQKKKFERRLTEVIKTNSKIVSSTQYDEIIGYLKTDDKSFFQLKLKRKVNANNYSLISFPSLAIHNLLCVPVSDDEKINVFNHFIIIFLMHSSEEKGLKDTRYRLAMPNTANTKNRLVLVFKGATTCRTSIHIAPLKRFAKRNNQDGSGVFER